MSYKYYKVKQLKNMRPGTVFQHDKLGMCIIVRDPETRNKRMVFKERTTPDVYFFYDRYPWNFPMKVVTGD